MYIITIKVKIFYFRFLANIKYNFINIKKFNFDIK